VKRTSNAPVSSEQVQFKQTSKTVCTDFQVPDEIHESVPDCGADMYTLPHIKCYTNHWFYFPFTKCICIQQFSLKCKLWIHEPSLCLSGVTLA